MEILSSKNYQEFLAYFPNIRTSLKEWQLVDVRLNGEPGTTLPIEKAAEMVHALFKDKEGKIFPCSDRALIMLIHWGRGDDPLLIPKNIETKFPPGSCKVVVHAPTAEGLGKLEILIQQGSASGQPPAVIRAGRWGNVILVADDDMYMRLLVKKGATGLATIHEVDNGSGVLAAYKEHAPDILFLDIHLPGRSGMDILSDIMAFDPQAYIIMLSADSSRDNVATAIEHGAKGFMAKPFTKEKLAEHLKNCPTFSKIASV